MFSTAELLGIALFTLFVIGVGLAIAQLDDAIATTVPDDQPAQDGETREEIESKRGRMRSVHHGGR